MRDPAPQIPLVQTIRHPYDYSREQIMYARALQAALGRGRLVVCVNPDGHD